MKSLKEEATVESSIKLRGCHNEFIPGSEEQDSRR